MMKRLMLAMVPMFALSTPAFADDLFSDLSALTAAEITDAQIAVEDQSDDFLDIDALLGQVGDADGDEAEEVHFRGRWGGGYRHFGHRHFGYRHFGYGYNHYRPFYGHYNYYPVYRIYTHYWGCY